MRNPHNWPMHGGPHVSAAAVIAVSVLLITSRSALALDPSKAITQYQLDVWTERNGLPQGSVQAITQTRDGYLWIGTRDGLARFDGVTFTVFRAEANEGMAANDIRALGEDKNGRLWVGTFNAGVSCYSDGQFKRYTKADGLPSNGVLKIFEDSRGVLWLGTWAGVARFDGKRFIAYRSAQGLVGRSALSICEDSEGQLCVATEAALNKLWGDRFEQVTDTDALPESPIQQVYAAKDGTLWMATVGDGVICFRNGKARRRCTKRDGLPDNKIASVLRDRDGNLWLGTWSGLSRVQNENVATLTGQDGLPHDYIGSLFEDHEGSLWIGTRGGGLARLRDARVSNYTTREGLAHNFGKCVFQDRHGSFWIGTHGGGLSRYQDGQFTTFTTDHGLPSLFVWAVAEDREGNLWAGTSRPAGICVFKEGRFTAYRGKEGLGVRSGVRAIVSDKDGNLWVGGDGGGLCRFRNGAFTCFTTEDGLPSNLIRVIYEDRSGVLWIGTNDGLCRYRNGKFSCYTTAEGLAHNAVYSIFEDCDGRIWIGTQGGLSRYANERFRSYTVRDGLFQNVIYQILEDETGTLWMSSNRGIFSVRKQAFAEFDSGKTRLLSCSSYGVADGMKAVQCEGGTQPAGCEAADGKLWFPTANGVAAIDPQKSGPPLPLAPVLIERAWAGKQKLDLRSPARLAPGARELRFEYTALSFAAPENVRFRYKLEGLDDQWVEGDTRRVAFYDKIPPGDYKFRVTACNSDGIWSENGAVFAFVLAPHFYQTHSFYLGCVLAMGAAGWAFHWHRMKRVHDKFSLVLAERNRIARELHDTLAQGLAGIAFQLEAVAIKLRQAPDHARQHLDVALKMVRHSLAEARRSVMNLRSAALDDRDLASALGETARTMLADRPIEFDIKTNGVARPLPQRIENNLLRIGQEAITNSVKYSKAKKICVVLDYRKDGVVLVARDDGTGFEHVIEGDGVHFGLLGMHERAKQMRARFNVISAPGKGTEVTVEVPLPSEQSE